MFIVDEAQKAKMSNHRTHDPIARPSLKQPF
jgi:hypothetical protein